MAETFEILINLLETFITVDFLTRYLGSKYSGGKKHIGFIIGWMMAFAEVGIINAVTEFETVGAYIQIIIYFVYSLIFLEGSLLQKAWVSILIHAIVTAIAILTNLTVCNIIGYDPYEMITVFNGIRVISVLITKIILFYITRLILKRKYKNPLNAYAWVILVIIPIVSVISLGALMKAAMLCGEAGGYILVGQICIVIADIMTYCFYLALNKEYENLIKIKLLEQQNENAKKHMEETEAFLERMQTIKHDIKNQLLTIYGYIEKNKNDEAKKYIETLTETYPSVAAVVNTDNDAFNAIVNSKMELCGRKKIFIGVQVQRNSVSGISAVDTGIIIGNLLDNAIEAADKTAQRRITLEVQRMGRYLSILVRNSIDKSVLEENPKLKTTKGDDEVHGIGIKSVCNVVEKYDGMIDFYEEWGEFCVHVMLDIER